MKHRPPAAAPSEVGKRARTLLPWRVYGKPAPTSSAVQIVTQFGMGSTGETCQRGFTRHPPRRDAGAGRVVVRLRGGCGSGVVPLALGSDTGGSIRLPASWCGVVGVKPTYGRVSRRGLLAYCSSTDCVGLFSRSVEDAAFALRLIAGHDDGDATSSTEECVPDYLSMLSIPTNDRVASINVEVDDDIESVVAGASNALKADACDSLSSEFLRDCAAAYHVLAAAEAHSNLARYHVNNENPPFGAEVTRRVALGKRLLGERHAEGLYERAVDVRAQARARLDDVLSSVDVLMLPVAPTAAPKLNAPPVITKEARGSLARDLRDDLPRSCAASFFVSCPRSSSTRWRLVDGSLSATTRRSGTTPTSRVVASMAWRAHVDDATTQGLRQRLPDGLRVARRPARGLGAVRPHVRWFARRRPDRWKGASTKLRCCGQRGAWKGGQALARRDALLLPRTRVARSLLWRMILATRKASMLDRHPAVTGAARTACAPVLTFP